MQRQSQDRSWHFGGMQRRPEGWKRREQGAAVEGEFAEAGGRPRRALGCHPRRSGDLGSLQRSRSGQ